MSGAQVWELGVIHGRFQVLHNDHVRYLLAGRARCRHLVVGITNPDPTVVRAHGADPGRHTPEANPLTYWERYRLVRAALGEQGVPPDAFSIVPFPVNVPELYRHYVPLDAVFFLTIYDEWGRHKLETFRGLGLRAHVLWEVPPEQKGLSAADIREAMARGEPWEDRVPASVAGLLKAWGVPARLRALYGGAPEASGPG